MKRENISSGSKWEPVLGYSRAVKVGQMVFVSGTTGGTDADGKVLSSTGDQTRRALEVILGALGKAGASAKDVVRTRVFMTDASEWEIVGKIHGEIFGEIRPAMTLVEVSRLIDSAMKVEIEMDAVITG
jgi:enamine deaminase RidA (YjgF/YER057c/UK114 family)